VILGGHNAHKTHCVRGHSLSGDNLYQRTNGQRGCVSCRNATRRRWEIQSGRVGECVTPFCNNRAREPRCRSCLVGLSKIRSRTMAQLSKSRVMALRRLALIEIVEGEA